jgi:hypothetical protein
MQPVTRASAARRRFFCRPAAAQQLARLSRPQVGGPQRCRRGLAKRLYEEAGLALARVHISLPTLHPDFEGFGCTWQANSGTAVGFTLDLPNRSGD